jgi:hypothetical protein
MTVPYRRVVVDGTITAAGFGGGHRFVVGRWPRSPIGPLGDVMWITPDGERVLLVGSRRAADFVTSIYHFDRVEIEPLRVSGDGRSTMVSSARLELTATGGRLRPIAPRRPLAVTRYLERPIARSLLGVTTYGVSPTGAREWYQARSWRPIVAGTARLDDRDLGPPGDVDRPVGVGFSEPLRPPSIVSLRVTIDLPLSGGGPLGSRRPDARAAQP